MDEALGGLTEIPLGVAGQARAVVEDREQDRVDPLPLVREYLERAVMEVQVPQATDVLGLVGTHLAAFTATLCDAARSFAGLLEQPLGQHEAAERRVGRQAPEVGKQDQVVEVELVAPLGMLLVLPPQGLGELMCDRRLAPTVAARLAP
jgi:hypothetical protein